MKYSNKSIALGLELKTKNYLKKALEFYKEPSEIDTRAMCFQDCADMYRVARHIYKDDIKGAVDHIHGMDTAAREVVWDYLDQLSGVDFYENYVMTNEIS